MIPIPSYQLIPFLAWLNQQGVRLSKEGIRSDQLNHLARVFLEAGGYLALADLAGIMFVFQECPMIPESDLRAQMEHFARCGQCIEMMNEHRHGRRWYGPSRERMWPSEGINTTSLHPFLAGFLEWPGSSRLRSRIRSLLSEHMDEREKRDHQDAFRHLIHMVGEELYECFNTYLSQVQNRNPRLIDDYESWRRSETRSGRLRECSVRSDENTHPLGENESLEQAAWRLADSVRLAIESGFYDQQMADEPRFARLMALTMESPENLGQALEFVNWLRQREPNLTVPGNIPSKEIEGLAQQFCEEQGYSNGKSFSKEVRQWLSGSGSDRIINRIADFLGLRKSRRLSNGRPVSRNYFDRYGSIRFHGLFLFLEAGNFPEFIEGRWRDLHHLTGDELDIYYSQKDLTERVSGYEIVNELRSLQVRVDALPALLLWENLLESNVTISLQGLDHDEVFNVLQAVVQAIHDGCSLAEIATRGEECSDGLRDKKGPKFINHGLLINGNGDIHMTIDERDQSTHIEAPVINSNLAAHSPNAKQTLNVSHDLEAGLEKILEKARTDDTISKTDCLQIIAWVAELREELSKAKPKQSVLERLLSNLGSFASLASLVNTIHPFLPTL